MSIACKCPPRQGAGGCCPVRTDYVEKQILPMGALEDSPNSDTGFGSATALSADGRILVVALPFSESGVGHVYVYERRCNHGVAPTATADDFVFLQELFGDEEDVDAQFGTSVAISGDGTRIAVGAPFQTNAPPGSPDDNTGAVYVFDRTLGRHACTSPYTLVQKVIAERRDSAGAVVPDTFIDNSFGVTVALSRNAQVLIVSSLVFKPDGLRGIVYWYTDCAPRGFSVRCSASNAPFLFSQRFDTEQVASEVHLTPSQLGQIGTSLALSANGSVAIVGASTSAGLSPLLNNVGRVLVYRRRTTVNHHACGAWVLDQVLEGDRELDVFGVAVALTPDSQYLAIESIEVSGAQSPDEFPRYVQVYRELWVAGHPQYVADGNALLAVSQQQNDAEIVRQRSLAVSDDGCIVAVGLEFTPAGPPEQNNAGQVAVFCRSRNNDGETVWTQRQQLDQGTNAQYDGRFGTSVSMSGDAKTLVAGVPDNQQEDAFALVYVYSSTIVRSPHH